MPDLWLIRHAQTDWSVGGRHTGRTDVPLNAAGRRDAELLRPVVEALGFTAVLCSPLSRARQTADLLGLEDPVDCDDLVELDYGAYEGLTTAEIRDTQPGWTVWTGGLPAGETLDAAAARADRAIDVAMSMAGEDERVALVAHGHILRIVGARWIGEPAASGAALALDTSTLSHLGVEHGRRVLRGWNMPGRLTATSRRAPGEAPR